MNVEIDVDELCSLRADLRALMEENEKLKEVNRVLGQEYSGTAFMLQQGRIKELEEDNEKLKEVNAARKRRIAQLASCCNGRKLDLLNFANEWIEAHP